MSGRHTPFSLGVFMVRDFIICACVLIPLIFGLVHYLLWCFDQEIL